MVKGMILLLLISSQLVVADKCYALAMEGGGMCGAYEAGALMALTEFVPISQLAYKIIGGISIGSYNTCWVSGFPVGQERAMAERLQEIWLSIKKRTQLIRFYRPILFGLLFEPALTDNRASLNFITSNMDYAIRRNVTVGTTNMNSGELVNFNETLGPEYLPTACWASGAYQLVLPPVYFMDDYWVDGCAVANMNGFIVINRCRELGYQDSDIVVDLLYDIHIEDMSKDTLNNTKELISKIDVVQNYFRGQWFISQFSANYPHVNFRYSISPSQPISSGSVDDIKYKIELGYNDTKRILGMTQAERTEMYQRKYAGLDHDFH